MFDSFLRGARAQLDEPKTFVQHTHCLQATVHRDNLMVNYKFEDVLFFFKAPKGFNICQRYLGKEEISMLLDYRFSKAPIWFAMFPLSRTLYQATPF